MPIAHGALIDMLRAPAAAEGRVVYVSIAHPETRMRRLLEKIPIGALRHAALQNYLHISMALRAWRAPRKALVIVMEFFPMHLLVAAPLFWLSGRRIAFVMHGCQQAAVGSLAHRLGLWHYRLYGFESIQLEISDEVLPPSCRLGSARRLILPHPIVSDHTPRLACGERLPATARIRIGVVGILRKGKPAAELLKRLASLIPSRFPDCDLIAGTPAWQDDGSLSLANVEVIDTGDMARYFEVLRSLDILVVDFHRDDYYYRASGTIADGSSCGCHVVCPDYPVLNHQVTWPARIGTTFKSHEGLETALAEAVKYVRANGQDSLWAYREKRDGAYLGQLIDEYLGGRDGSAQK